MKEKTTEGLIMKKMKKLLAVMLSACILLSCLCVFAGAADRKTALSTAAGIQALRNEFDSDKAPKAGGYALDYCYYSPVGDNDDTKYPLVISCMASVMPIMRAHSWMTAIFRTGHQVSCRAVFRKAEPLFFCPEHPSISLFTGEPL